MDKEDTVYIHNQIVLSHIKEWNCIICSNVDGPRDYYSKWSKLGREKQMSYDITYMWNLKKKWYKQTYLQNRNRLTNTENRIVVAEGQRGKGG